MKAISPLLAAILLVACDPAAMGAPATVSADTAKAAPAEAATAQRQSERPDGGSAIVATEADAFLRDSYHECAAHTGGSTWDVQACIEKEFEYQDDRLNAAYRKVMAKLVDQERSRLRSEERRWISDRDSTCSWDAHSEGQAQRIEANVCALQKTAKRAAELEEREIAGANEAAAAGSQDALQRAAVMATERLGGELARVAVSGDAAPMAAVIRYRAKGVSREVPACSLSIVEGLPDHPVVTAENDALIACPLASDAAAAREQTTLTFKGNRIRVSNDADNGNDTFELQRLDGAWYVTDASFAHPVEDPATGDIVVVNEKAAYSPESWKIKVSDYSYDAIEPHLVIRTIE